MINTRSGAMTNPKDAFINIGSWHLRAAAGRPEFSGVLHGQSACVCYSRTSFGFCNSLPRTMCQRGCDDACIVLLRRTILDRAGNRASTCRQATLPGRSGIHLHRVNQRGQLPPERQISSR